MVRQWKSRRDCLDLALADAHEIDAFLPGTPGHEFRVPGVPSQGSQALHQACIDGRADLDLRPKMGHQRIEGAHFYRSCGVEWRLVRTPVRDGGEQGILCHGITRRKA